MTARMPPEWAPHTRTWMEFPPLNETFTRDPERYRAAWTAVANTIAQYEPVTVVCRASNEHEHEHGDGVRDADAARVLFDPEAEHPITIVEAAIDDAWVRDSGPTFTLHDDGSLGAIHWRFNAWGDAGFSSFADEQHVGRFIATSAGLTDDRIVSSAMVNEGGGIHVDGDGTVLVTDTVQLDPARNPGWTRIDVEEELHRRLGTTRAIWLPRGLTRDYERFGTRGHVDIVTCFVRPGTLVAHVQPDPAHPDFEICQELIGMLRAERDAAGRRLEVIELEAPSVVDDGDGWVDYSYVNHYVCNGAVILCAFDDRRDELAAETLADLYPDREVVLVDARPLFECGGGIHCITQQEPAPVRSTTNR